MEMSTPFHPVAAAAPMLLRTNEAGLLGTATVQPAMTVPLDALAGKTAARLAALQPDERLIGALPFDPRAPSHLLTMAVQTDMAAIDAWLLAQTQGPANTQPAAVAWQLHAEPRRADYEASVAECVQRLQQRDTTLRKVVLARTLLAQSRQPVCPWWLAQRLATDPNVLRYVVPLPVAAGAAPAWLVGASPERLLARRGEHILSQPLAGSAARSADEATSRANADALRHSAKDGIEHRYVVQAIADALTPLCRTLQVPREPRLYATETMWHLGTRIEGTLKDTAPDALAQTSSVALAALLHPTPAVGGTPRDLALQTIRELELVPRGFYAGAVGWCDARGDGDWHIALRCAHVQGCELRLFAGAGIVADSDPASEAAETRAKFGAMLHALGVTDDAVTE